MHSQKQKYQNLRAGFSLVELLVVLAIMILMTGALLVSQNKNKSNDEVQAAARQLAAQLRSVQNDALNGKQFSTPAVSACSFEVVVTNNSTDYILKYNKNCDSGFPMGMEIGGTRQTIKFNAKASVLAASDNDFAFAAPRGNLSTATQTIVLKAKSDPTMKYNVCVYSTGNILEQKGAC